MIDYNDEIVSIEYVGELESVDINISGDRLFYANGVLSHNSAIDVSRKSQAHIAGGISKINTSDITVAISRTDDQIDKGIVELQFLKLRNASMNHTPVILNWSDDTLRITDGMRPNSPQIKPVVMDQKSELASLLEATKKKRKRKS